MKGIVSLTLVAFATHVAAARPPNFIIFYADDLGYADTSVQMMDSDPSTKHRFIQTPGLDRLAEMGTRFTAAYSPTPTCTGSRLSIQFGKSSARLQCRNVFDVLSRKQRPDGYGDEISMARVLKGSGGNYITAMFGKGCSVLGRFDAIGYDVTDEQPGDPGGNGNGHGSYWDPKKKTPFPPDDPKRLYSLKRSSVDFINRYAGKQPFFMMVSHYAAHIPHMATEKAIERVNERWAAMDKGKETQGDKRSDGAPDSRYCAMVEEMDLNMSAIIDALKARGELDNTYIIFTSDNGGGHSRKVEINGEKRSFNGPLQEGKRSIFEGGIRVPTIVAGPGIKGGSECDVPIVQWDFLPTFHDLAGSKAPLPGGIDGGSLRDVFENGNKGRVKRAAPGIIHHYPCHYHPPISSIRIGDYKLMRHLSSGEVRLYNVKTDYREEQDLASSMPEKAAAMDAVRQRYIDEVNGGRIEDVYRALYETMDEFSERSRDGFRKDLAKLKVQKPADFEAKKKKLLEKLNESLMKHEITKERTRIYSKMNTWRKHSPKSEAEKVVMRNWTNVTE